MFKGKVYSYSNINWKEKRFEKEFDDMSEYNNFILSHPDFSEFNQMHKWLSFDSIFDFNSYLDHFFKSKYIRWFHDRERLHSQEEETTSGVDLSKYESEVIKLDDEKRRKADHRKSLENTRVKLKTYLDRFKKENKHELAKQIEEDISKVDTELNNL